MKGSMIFFTICFIITFIVRLIISIDLSMLSKKENMTSMDMMDAFKNKSLNNKAMKRIEIQNKILKYLFTFIITYTVIVIILIAFKY